MAKNTYKKQYEKERKRIKQFIRRAEKRGYIFPENILPSKPKRITKSSVNRLKKINVDYLYKKSQYSSFLSYGEILSGLEGKKLEKQSIKQKRMGVVRESSVNYGIKFNTLYNENVNYDTDFFSDTVILNFRSHVNQFNERASDLLNSWLDKLLLTNSPDEVAQMLNKGAEEGNLINYQIVYSENQLTNYISEMTDYLPDQGELFKEQLLEALEEDGYLSYP